VFVEKLRAPGLNTFEFHSQSKRERERALFKLRRRGGVCLTSYGIVVNCAEQLATGDNGQDYIWVKS
jgi:DNA excision repair protein ERCC-6-like